ncbi:MAG: hypothetical protein KGH56_01650 [Patescibacteria group bacterium]|nr:hypothetical protein [Patescibacteria group bacterium]
MSERLPKIPTIESAPTNEQIQEQVREGAAMSPEEKKAAQRAYMQEMQDRPTIKLTPEEIKARKEREERQKQRAAQSLGGETAKRFLCDRDGIKLFLHSVCSGLLHYIQVRTSDVLTF